MNTTIWVSSIGGNSSNTTNDSNNNNDGDNEVVRTSMLTQSHVDRLTEQTKNNLIKTRLQQMEADVSIANKEQGSEFRKISNGYTEHQIPAAQLNFSGTRFPTAVASSEVRVHLHHDNSMINANGEELKLATVFSEDDIFGMAQFFHDKKLANAGNLMEADGNISSILVSRRGLYAMRINDPVKATQFLQDLKDPLLVNSKDISFKNHIIAQFREKVIEKTQDFCEQQNCSDALEEAVFELNFLTFFKTLNSGISIFVSLEIDVNGDYIWLPLTN